jgi:hypothetical protein
MCTEVQGKSSEAIIPLGIQNRPRAKQAVLPLRHLAHFSSACHYPQLWREASCALSGRLTLRNLTQSLGLRPRPWAVFCRPFRPKESENSGRGSPLPKPLQTLASSASSASRASGSKRGSSEPSRSMCGRSGDSVLRAGTGRRGVGAPVLVCLRARLRG